jgi:hypothetical protein
MLTARGESFVIFTASEYGSIPAAHPLKEAATTNNAATHEQSRQEGTPDQYPFLPKAIPHAGPGEVRVPRT